MKQTTSSILMIEPVAFRFNPDAARTNSFMREVPGLDPGEAQTRALAEFRALVETLRREGVEVFVRRDEPQPSTPDSIFPNNWVSFHPDGRVVLYPLEPESRRLERRLDILDWLRNEHRFVISEITDLTHHEREGRFLEGTGSMVFDRRHRVIYASMSPRTTPSLLEEYAREFDFALVPFHAFDASGAAVYHTNVVMALGNRVAVVCGDSIRDVSERERVFDSLRRSGHDIIDITVDQLHAFVGNMIELEDEAGSSLFVMSGRARAALGSSGLRRLETHGRIVSSSIPTIEDCGGGSVRCMIVEIFLPRRRAP